MSSQRIWVLVLVVLFGSFGQANAQGNVIFKKTGVIGNQPGPGQPQMTGGYCVWYPANDLLQFKSGVVYQIEVQGTNYWDPIVYITTFAPKGSTGDIGLKAGGATDWFGMVIIEKRTALKNSYALSFQFTGREAKGGLYIARPSGGMVSSDFQVTVTELGASAPTKAPVKLPPKKEVK